MADSSIQGSPPSDYGKWIEQDYRNEQRNNALAGRARANQKNKNDATDNKYLHDIEIATGKVHPADDAAARQNLNDFLVAKDNAREQYGENNYINYLPRIAEPYYEKARQINTNKQYLDKAYADIEAQEKETGETPETKAAKENLMSGHLENIKPDKYGRIEKETGDNGLTRVVFNRYPKYEWGKEIQSENSKNRPLISTTQINNPSLQEGEKGYLVGSSSLRTKDEADAFAKKTGIRLPSNEENIRNLVDSPTHFVSAEQEVRDQLPDDYSKDWPMPKRKDAVAKAMFDKFGNYGAVKYDYKVDKPKSSGYNSKTGEGSNERFNTAPLTDGTIGHDLKYIGTDETKPKAIFKATDSGVLQGDAPAADSKYHAKDWKGQQEGFLSGHKALVNPNTGKKEMYFIITKGAEAAGSSNTGSSVQHTVTKEDVAGTTDWAKVNKDLAVKENLNSQVTTRSGESEKDKTPIRTWLIPARDNEAQASDFAKDKKGNNPYMMGYKHDLARMEAENAKVKSSGAKSTSSEGAFDQGLPTKTKVTTSDPRIDAFMKSNKITDRNEAIKILKENKIIE